MYFFFESKSDFIRSYSIFHKHNAHRGKSATFLSFTSRGMMSSVCSASETSKPEYNLIFQ